MSESKIHSALVSAYIASGVMPAARTAFEDKGIDGKDFTPPQGESWARIRTVPTDRGPAAQGSGAAQEWRGYLEVMLFYPKGAGPFPALADVDKALAYFYSGKHLDYQGQGVLIRRAERSQIRQEDVWQSVSVSVYCTAWSFPA